MVMSSVESAISCICNMVGMVTVTSMDHDENFTGKVNWPSSVPMPMIMLGMSKIANHLSCNNFHVLQQTMCEGQDTNLFHAP